MKSQLKQADARACNSHSLCFCCTRSLFATCAVPLVAANIAALNTLHAGVYSTGSGLNHNTSTKGA